MKRTLSASLLAVSASLMASAAWAQSPPQTTGPVGGAFENVSVTTGIDSVTEYVFRGVSLGGASLQPYTELSLGGFTVGAWYSAGFGAESDVQADEVDLYANYSLPIEGPVAVDVGITYYHYPQGPGSLFETADGAAGTYEVYGSASFGNFALAPTATVYYDFTLEAFTLEGTIGNSWELSRPGWSFDAGLTAGHVEPEGPGDYQWGTATAGFSKAVNEDVSFFVNGNFTVNSEDNTLNFDRIGDPETGFAVATLDSDTKFWLGSGVSVSF